MCKNAQEIREQISFTVYGRPAQMGSKRAFVRSGKAVMVNDNSERLRQWYNAVASKAAEVMNGRDLISGAVRLSVVFFFKRPKAHFGTGRNAGILKKTAPVEHTQKPDLDKLVRLLCDALSATVWRDDSQVVEYGCVRRAWTTSQERAEVKVEWLGYEPRTLDITGPEKRPPFVPT